MVDANARIAWVETALVHHHRAASWLRDEEQVIADPYPLLFSVAVFVEQSSPANASTVLGNWLSVWKNGQAELVPEEQRSLVPRAGATGHRGRRARGPTAQRPHVRIGRQRRGDFRPYV